MTERLIAYLQSRANRRGLVLVGEATLLRDLGASRGEIVEALRALESAGKLEILAPLPFLVVVFLPRPWSGSSPSPKLEKPEISSNPRFVHIEVPVSNSIAAAATQQPEVGGAGEGTARLDQVLAALGPEADREEFRQILAGHDAALIQRCLRRVQATRNIRVSRAALFRSLLQKLSH